MAKTYEVLSGINYRDKRREPGAKVEDLTDSEAKSLLKLGAIRPVKADRKEKG